MGVLAMCLVVMLFVAMGFASEVDEVLEALKHPVAHGRHVAVLPGIQDSGGG